VTVGAQHAADTACVDAAVNLRQGGLIMCSENFYTHSFCKLGLATGGILT
jgi:hypothetical protein